MIESIPFKPGHLDLMPIKEIYAGDPTLIERTHYICSSPGVLAYTLVRNGLVIAVIGGHILWPGVMQVWMITSDRCREFPKDFHTSILKTMDFVIARYNLRRIQCEVKYGYDEGVRWITSLGFQCEGIMREYGPEGSDYILYARVK